MSLIITTYVREGIVMSSDSRLSINNKSLDIKNVTQSDSVRKTFVTQRGVGISTCGSADIKGVPIAGYIDSFISEIIADSIPSVKEVTSKLLEYFRKLNPDLQTIFHIAGYDIVKEVDFETREQKIYRCHISNNTIEEINKVRNVQGSIFNGYHNIIAKLLNTVYIKNADGKPEVEIPFNGLAWLFLTLQDAIDFNRFGTQTTIDAMKFEMTDKTVGGPIDILVITPNYHKWVQHKELK